VKKKGKKRRKASPLSGDQRKGSVENFPKKYLFKSFIFRGIISRIRVKRG